MILEATRKPIEEPSPFDVERDEHSRPHDTWGEAPLEGVDTRPASATSLGVSGRPCASQGDRSGQLIAFS